jgi:hypothetical protein
VLRIEIRFGFPAVEIDRSQQANEFLTPFGICASSGENAIPIGDLRGGDAFGPDDAAPVRVDGIDTLFFHVGTFANAPASRLGPDTAMPCNSRFDEWNQACRAGRRQIEMTAHHARDRFARALHYITRSRLMSTPAALSASTVAR